MLLFKHLPCLSAFLRCWVHSDSKSQFVFSATQTFAKVRGTVSSPRKISMLLCVSDMTVSLSNLGRVFHEAVKGLCFKMLQSWESRDEIQSRLLRVRQYFHVLSSLSKINTFLIYCHQPFEKNVTVTSVGIVHAACFYLGRKLCLFYLVNKLKNGYGGTLEYRLLYSKN